MTLEELESTLPSGFHDSAVKGVEIDYVRRTILLKMSLAVGDPDGSREQRDDYRDAEIEIFGFIFFVIDPPSVTYDFGSPGEIWVKDGYPTRSIPKFTETIGQELLNSVTAEAFIHSFFVNDWNSYIHIAARDCAMEWIGVQRHYRGPRQIFYPGETVDL